MAFHFLRVFYFFAVRFSFGARSNGVVEVYRNSTLVLSLNVSGWSYAASGGQIGLWPYDTTAGTLDDFGGGNSAVAFAPQSDNLFRFTNDAPRDDAPPTPSDSPLQQTTTSVTKYYYLGGGCASKFCVRLTLACDIG